MLNNKVKLACFDMDGTLIRNINSVRYLCKINGYLDEVLDIEMQEEENKLDWIEADYKKAKLMKGLKIDKIKSEFNTEIMLIKNIKEVIQKLKERKIKSILVTAGPIQVAKIIGDKFDFDKAYGSRYEVKDKMFTGNIIKHLGASGKLDSLISYCNKNNILLNECISIGDSDSDLELFKKCKKSIAINYSDVLVGKADIYIKTNDIKDILEYF